MKITRAQLKKLRAEFKKNQELILQLETIIEVLKREQDRLNKLMKSIL